LYSRRKGEGDNVANFLPASLWESVKLLVLNCAELFQVSPKGLKIIQNVDGRVKGGRGRNHTVKHFLPSDSVTEVVSRGDAVVCVLLLYNPVTKLVKL
jgi:hypothetical protein